MKTVDEINKIIDKIAGSLSDDVQKHPHFLINEHDLKAYIYSILVNLNCCNKYVLDDEGDEGDENYLVHCEYCRGIRENKKFKTIGFWDIAVLSEKQDNKYWWKEKPVFLGIELKSNIDEKSKKIIYGIDCDQPAVESDAGFNKYADYALLFHINIGKKSRDNTFAEVKEYIEKTFMGNNKTFYVFCQFYKDRSKPDVLVHFPKDSKQMHKSKNF